MLSYIIPEVIVYFLKNIPFLDNFMVSNQGLKTVVQNQNHVHMLNSVSIYTGLHNFLKKGLSIEKWVKDLNRNVTKWSKNT